MMLHLMPCSNSRTFPDKYLKKTKCSLGIGACQSFERASAYHGDYIKMIGLLAVDELLVTMQQEYLMWMPKCIIIVGVHIYWHITILLKTTGFYFVLNVMINTVDMGVNNILYYYDYCSI